MRRLERFWLIFHLFSCMGMLVMSDVTSAAGGNGGAGGLLGGKLKNPNTAPNILFVVMDDVGIDQMKLYGYGGESPSKLPNIEAIASKGVVFTNAWAMPDCSPSRATFFTGRMPARDHVLNPIQPPDLANSQVSPYAMTLPKLLRRKGYINGMVGKMHLSGSVQNNGTNPLGLEVYPELGWNYFNGYLEGSPYSIDTTAGGVAPTGTYGCGFIPNKTDDPVNGADMGACYLPNGSCTDMSTASSRTPGRACLESGGILNPGESCQASPPANLQFTNQNGYYTANWVENLQTGKTNFIPPGDSKVNAANYRGYRSILEADRAIALINQLKNQSQPWMVSVGFSSAHSPWHNVPESILPPGSANTNAFNCTGNAADAEVHQQLHVLMKQMEEGLDHELGRILVGTGLASYKPDGSIDYNPEASNTLIVIIGDNGTYTTVVNEPFDPTRAKGTPYQTGVWVPLIAAGPMVKSPGREVDHMVNGMDLYKLFAEVAGIDADRVVPKTQKLDAKPMLSYLTQPAKASIRKNNLTQTGLNYRASYANAPCVVPSMAACTPFFPTMALCTKNSGIWYGPGSTQPGVPAEGLSDCCAVNSLLESQGQSQLLIQPEILTAIRNNQYKLVTYTTQDCKNPGNTTATNEFYQINEDVPVPLIDWESLNLLASGSTDALSPVQKRNYKQLSKQLTNWSNTVVYECPGDGNLDLVVNDLDVQGWRFFATSNGGQSSWFDFNFDGLTNLEDLDIINANFGKRCKPGQSGGQVISAVAGQ